MRAVNISVPLLKMWLFFDMNGSRALIPTTVCSHLSSLSLESAQKFGSLLLMCPYDHVRGEQTKPESGSRPEAPDLSL